MLIDISIVTHVPDTLSAIYVKNLHECIYANGDHIYVNMFMVSHRIIMTYGCKCMCIGKYVHDHIYYRN